MGVRMASRVRTPLRIGFVLVAAIAVAIGWTGPLQAAGPPGYQTSDVGAFGGEPSIVSDKLGQLYDATPSGGTLTYTSTNHGVNWKQVTTADPNSGDDCLATDQANAVYLCNLAGSQGVAPLQADVWKSVDHGATWTHGAGAIPQCATSCSAFGVDRDWLAASILPPATQTSQAEGVLMYHDFFVPSRMWLNISHGAGAIPQCATSCSAFGVDRDWLAASILPPATQTSQ